MPASRPWPDVIRIEPTGVCNFRCTHCPVGVEGGKRRVLAYDEFVKFFNMLPKVPRVLVLYHGGEPLLNKRLGDMIAYAKSKGVQKIKLNSNASLLTDETDISLLDEIWFSFDGQSVEENNAIRVGSDFEKHAAAVKRLALSDTRPTKIVIYNASNGEPAAYLQEYFKDCSVEFRGDPIRTWARVAGQPHATNGTTHCTSLFETFTILSDGSVPMCCEDLQGDDIQGNVYENTPLEIWERMEERRQAFARKEYPKLCQTCWVTQA